jgi:hypothetical protein
MQRHIVNCHLGNNQEIMKLHHMNYGNVSFSKHLKFVFAEFADKISFMLFLEIN